MCDNEISDSVLDGWIWTAEMLLVMRFGISLTLVNTRSPDFRAFPKKRDMKGIPAPKKRKTTTVSAQDNVARISLLSEGGSKQLRDFVSKKVASSGNIRCIFYASYFFEKLRIMG
ncbi:uncharacterized protein K441DRAFT_698874 [Cenococcum geophilum 1.58]|uniref:uncharacterized protein n=1 Tax=Cenococcum geophilum 1.58 TaxID=794803 RepID=UPI00358DE4ED|nr:hypothetical protein K441DRAFT_698874 [Cenococcum geophilum 1.58]